MNRTRPRRRGARTAPCTLATLLLLALQSACGPADDGATEQAEAPAAAERRLPNIAVVVLDTVRPDMLSSYGYPVSTSPFLERFAAEGTRFERAYSTSCWTLPAHGSLFTGHLPQVHGATQAGGRVPDEMPVLTEDLRAAGYQTAAFSGNIWISKRSGLDRGFEHFVPLFKGYRKHVQELAAREEPSEFDPQQHDTVRALRRWVDEDRDPERPWFVFVNLVDAHLPYLPPWGEVDDRLESNDQRVAAVRDLYPGGDGVRLIRRHYAGEEPLDEAEWDVVRRMYEGSLRVTDALAESLVGILDEVSDSDETLVFLLSDHGENLGDHGHLTHIFNLYDSNLRILLQARGPGFEPGTVRSEPVQIVDLHQTILRSAHVQPEPSAQGTDLRNALFDDRILHASLEYPHISLRLFPEELHASPALARYRRELRAVVGPRYKLVRGSDGTEELFDLQSDPDEASPLDPASADPRALARLRAALKAADDLEPYSPPTESNEWETEDGLSELREMGYAE